MKRLEQLADRPTSARLGFQRIAAEQLAVFHALALDEHVRRFLLDGECVSEVWCAQAIAASEREYARNKLGLWLLSERADARAEPIGFAGFWRFDGVGDAPQLVYALKQAYTGRGYASETAVALVEFARAHGSVADVDAAVDEPNQASWRLLERLGFVQVGEAPGAFGTMRLYRLARDVTPRG